jgi:hypothetical protein
MHCLHSFYIKYLVYLEASNLCYVRVQSPVSDILSTFHHGVAKIHPNGEFEGYNDFTEL